MTIAEHPDDVLDRTDELRELAAAEGEPHDPGDPEDQFWHSRPVLAHLRDFARARRAGPWAVLGVALARVIAAVEPNVVLPPEIGTEASLNVFTALCGVSGAGKGAAEGAAAAAIGFVDQSGRDIEVTAPNIGSGEGLAKVFRKPDDDELSTSAVTRAIISVPEIGTLAALSGRQGSTLNAELLKIFIGEPIGFTNASKVTTTAVGRHEYRLCLMVGVQPENASTLLSATKDGLPQRFLWLPVADPYAPRIKPAAPPRWNVKIPNWSAEGLQHVHIPDVARHAIDDHRYRVLIGEPVDPLNSHQLLCREKIAAALMLLDGRSVMGPEDWAIAGQVLDVSDQTRGAMQRVLDDKRRSVNHARAKTEGERAVVSDTMKSDASVRRAADAIVRKLHRAGPCTEAELRRAVAAAIRGDFGVAFGELLDDDQVRRAAGDGDPVRYELT